MSKKNIKPSKRNAGPAIGGSIKKTGGRRQVKTPPPPPSSASQKQEIKFLDVTAFSGQINMFLANLQTERNMLVEHINKLAKELEALKKGREEWKNY